MKISSPVDTSITDIRPKVIETAEGFLLNTQYYTKETLSPVPFENLCIYGATTALSTQKQLYLQAYNWRDPQDEFGITRDTSLNYPDRHYLRVISGYITGSDSTRFVVLEKQNNELWFLYEWAPAYQFLDTDQDDRYLYIISRNNTTTYMTTYDKLANTVTGRSSIGFSYAYGRYSVVYKDEHYINLMAYGDEHVWFFQYDKVNQTMYISPAKIYRGEMQDTPKNLTYTTYCDDPYQVSDHEYGFYYFNADNPNQPIDLYCYDIDKDADTGFTMKHVNIGWGGGKSKIDIPCTSAEDNAHFFIAEHNGNKYLNLVTYKINYNSNTWIPFQGIYTFKINSPTSITFTGYNQIDGAKQIGGFIYDESKTHLIIAKQNAFEILRFNTTTQKYESTNFEVSSCVSAGLDECQRVWYAKTDTSVHMINLEDAQSVEIEFEKQTYEYTGSTINTYIDFSALNYLGETFEGVFELRINGPAVFTENGSTQLRFNYKGTGKQRINVTISGAAPITIFPKFIS